jgi:hypothetical protein
VLDPRDSAALTSQSCVSGNEFAVSVRVFFILMNILDCKDQAGMDESVDSIQA